MRTFLDILSVTILQTNEVSNEMEQMDIILKMQEERLRLSNISDLYFLEAEDSDTHAHTYVNNPINIYIVC